MQVIGSLYIHYYFTLIISSFKGFFSRITIFFIINSFISQLILCCKRAFLINKSTTIFITRYLWD